MITLINGVQVPENAVQLRTTAPMDGYYVTQPLRLVQYDETMPVAAVQLTYQNQPYTPPTGAELNVRMGKPDGTTVYNPCLGMDSSGIVYFAFTQQMTIVAGTGTLTVEITDSGVKNSAPIIAEIRPNPVPEGSIESADEFLTLQEILAEAEKWGQIVQANASNIQQVVDNLTDIQSAAENAQAAAASAEAAQQAAQEALGFRKFYSAVVPDANGNLDPSRPMTVGPAASVEIESAGDRIQSVTALGFTRQAGTGDPSPTNVRALTNGGINMVELVLTGSESGRMYAGFFYLDGFKGIAAKDTDSGYCNSFAYKTYYPGKIGVNSVGDSVIYAPNDDYSADSNGLNAFKAMLAARYAAGNPVKVWYVPVDESQATGLYAPIILEGGEYRATCLPLTAPLCEGDSVVSWIKSGCDVELTFDGSEDENWGTETLSGNVIRYWIKMDSNIAQADSANGFALANWLTLAVTGGTGNASLQNVFTITADQRLYVRTTNETLDEFKAKLKANPLFVCCRSTNYTEKNEIQVSLETHVGWVYAFSGTEGWTAGGVGAYLSSANLPGNKTPTSGKCSHFKYQYSYSANAIMVESSGRVALGTAAVSELGFSGTEDWKSYLAAQYAAGTPVTIVYQLATPITYAHPAVVLEASTVDQLTYTVTGQSGGTVSVALKPFQDGGHAKTADNATNAQNADNATQFDGHAWSEVPGQAPVQSVNSKTGAVVLTAADVGAATTAQGKKADSSLIFMGLLPNGTAVNSIQNGIWDGDASHRPNPAPDGLNEDLTIVKAGRYLQATDVFGNAKRWNFYSSVWSDPV